MGRGIVFFDIGGTLATGAGQSPRRLLASRLDLSENETKRVGRLIMVHPATEPAELARDLGKILPRHEPRRLLSILESVWFQQTDCVREIGGATGLVAALKEMGFKAGIISNTWHPLYEGFRRNCAELADLFDCAFLSYRRGIKKPSPALFADAVREAGEPGELCCMVGDTYELDVAPAREAGMKTIWVLRQPERELSELVEMLRGTRLPPDWTVRSIGELLPFFGKECERWLKSP